MIVKHPLRPILLSALAITALLFWSGCNKYSTAPIIQPPPNNNPNILSLSNASGAPGDTGIIVDVNLHNVEPIAGAQLRITYNVNVLQPSDTPYLKPTRADQMDFYAGNFNTPGVVTFATSWFTQKGVIAIGDGAILQLIFDVKPGASVGTSSLRFESDATLPTEDNALSDTTGTKLIVPQVQNGTFTVP